MTLKLNGSSSGSVSLDAPASTTGGADVALTLPVSDGESGQVLRTNGSGTLSWIWPAGTGAFRASRTTNQTIAHATDTIIEYATEEIDLKSWYDTSTYKYTPQVAGYYNIRSSVLLTGVGATADMELQIKIFKNTTNIATGADSHVDIYSGLFSVRQSAIVQMNGSSDYLLCKCYQANNFSSGETLNGNTLYNFFEGYLLEAT